MHLSSCFVAKEAKKFIQRHILNGAWCPIIIDNSLLQHYAAPLTASSYTQCRTSHTHTYDHYHPQHTALSTRNSKHLYYLNKFNLLSSLFCFFYNIKVEIYGSGVTTIFSFLSYYVCTLCKTLFLLSDRMVLISSRRSSHSIIFYSDFTLLRQVLDTEGQFG